MLPGKKRAGASLEERPFTGNRYALHLTHKQLLITPVGRR
jgi:hypothetical protein